MAIFFTNQIIRYCDFLQFPGPPRGEREFQGRGTVEQESAGSTQKTNREWAQKQANDKEKNSNHRSMRIYADKGIVKGQTRPFTDCQISLVGNNARK
jgi:hypothetical protein